MYSQTKGNVQID